MDADDRLRLDYEKTTQLLATLVDIRFKLLAFVPTISGAAVALIGRPRPAVELLAIGTLGLVATLGILMYELRNTQFHDAVIHRAKEIEARLGFFAATGSGAHGGAFSERPRRSVRLFGLLTVGHDRGLAVVYGAAIAGWVYLVAWGVLRALDAGHARTAGIVIGAIAGLAVVFEVERIDRRLDKAGSPVETPRGPSGAE